MQLIGLVRPKEEHLSSVPTKVKTRVLHKTGKFLNYKLKVGV